MKFITTISALAIAGALSAAPALADQIDPNNPNVTNERVDEDGQRDIASRFKECQELQGSLPQTPTEEQLGLFETQCEDFYNKETGLLSIPDNATEQQLGTTTN